MARWRQAVELAVTDQEIGKLPASRVERAQMLLAYGENPSFFLVGRQLGVHAALSNKPDKSVAIVSDDEKPGIQAKSRKKPNRGRNPASS
jgi:hypothetical protein